MVYIILILLTLAAAELAAALGVLALRLWKDARGAAALERSDRDAREEAGRREDFEKLWQEGMDSVMGYDLRAARRAARRDEDEE